MLSEKFETGAADSALVVPTLSPSVKEVSVVILTPPTTFLDALKPNANCFPCFDEDRLLFFF